MFMSWAFGLYLATCERPKGLGGWDSSAWRHAKARHQAQAVFSAETGGCDQGPGTRLPGDRRDVTRSPGGSRKERSIW